MCPLAMRSFCNGSGPLIPSASLDGVTPGEYGPYEGEGNAVNVLYLHTHDTGCVISPYGYATDTPNMQALAEDGMLFEHAFSVAPTCSPSRAGLLTGTFPHQNGMLGLAQRGFELDGSKHLARLLSQAGWRSVLCGVQHEVGYYTDHALAPAALGYDEDITADASSFSERDLVVWDAENARRLVAWFESGEADQPFFVSFGQHATHRAWPEPEPGAADYARPPVNIPSNETTREDYAGYLQSVRMADDNVGLVIDALKRSGHYEDTIILLTTDHGLAFPFEKCTLTDAGTGVLMAIRVPGSTQLGRTFEGLVSHIDVVPTLLDLLGIERPDYLEGRSLAGLFSGEELPGDDAVFAEVNFHTSYEPMRSVRTERYKYIRYFDDEWLRVNQSNIDGSPTKQFFEEHGLADVTKEAECLYDLYYDTYECRNVASDARYADVLAEMRARLHEFMERTNDPLLRGPIEIKPCWKVNRRECVSAGSKDPADYESLGDHFSVRERGMA